MAWNPFKQEPDKDEKVILALKEQGSDIKKPHEIDFWLDFDNEGSARRAAEYLQVKQYGVQILRSEDQTLYTCQAKKTLVPAIETMRSITVEFEELAHNLGGKYDGWGAEVVS